MRRRIQLRLILVVASVWLASAHLGARPHSRPNILWLVGENLSHDLACYGAANVVTPHLDRLARDGVRYTRVFATNPACAPSRSAFFTGWYQTSTDLHPMRAHRDDDYRLPPGVRSITHRLRDAGYATVNLRTIDGERVGTGKLDLNFVNEGALYDHPAAEWATLPRDRPFFMVVNAEESEYDIYDRQSAAKSRVEWVGEAEHVQHAQPDRVRPPPYYPDHPVVREEWARYLNSVSGMDRRFGRVLERLEREGLADDTVVIFFGDNGRLEPRGIHWCYDSGLRVPMIIRWPKNMTPPDHYQPGTVDGRLISLIDVTATTLVAAGVPLPLLMHGRTFLGAEAGPPRRFVFAARDRIDETVQRIRSVHDERFHYIRTFSKGPTFSSLNRYKEKCFLILPVMRRLQAEGRLTGPPLELMERAGPLEELYDTEADPDEIHNLAVSAHPDHRAALERLRAALDTWMAETGDRGGVVESADELERITAEMDRWFGTPSWARALQP
ncbi:MAG: sulfatase [Opitutaceae bacterium]|nr:sulfatase [Opitutaceae bacterium]